MNNKELFIFDLDGTLAESKQTLDSEMADLLSKLLSKKKVAVISGGSFTQFEKQFLPAIKVVSFYKNLYKNLFLFPTSGTAFYKYEKDGWKKIYDEELSKKDKEKIKNVLEYAEKNLGLKENKSYGEKIEDRGSQITYSALGQEAPLEVKQTWDPEQETRKNIVRNIQPFLNNFGITIGGMTSIDITRKGIDKAYGIRQMVEKLKIPLIKMVFIGDALFFGGNDYPAKTTGIDCVSVNKIEDTKNFIKSVIQ